MYNFYTAIYNVNHLRNELILRQLNFVVCSLVLYTVIIQIGSTEQGSRHRTPLKSLSQGRLTAPSPFQQSQALPRPETAPPAAEIPLFNELTDPVFATLNPEPANGSADDFVTHDPGVTQMESTSPTASAEITLQKDFWKRFGIIRQ